VLALDRTVMFWKTGRECRQRVCLGPRWFYFTGQAQAIRAFVTVSA
jgi:hypothetical protein